MKLLEIYDPALCCSSGVCGPSPDQSLASFAGTLEKIKASGVAVKRYNLAHEPLAFAHQAEVKAALEKQGEAGLPLLFIDGDIHFRGAYPSLEQLSKALGIESSSSVSCCGEDDDCCQEPAKKEPSSYVKVERPTTAQSGCCDSASGCC